MSWHASYQLLEAGAFFIGFVALLVFSRCRPGYATNFLNVAIPCSLLLAVAFTAAHYLSGTSERAEVAGALAKELPFIVILSVLCVVQAEFLQGVLEGPRIRRVLYAAPKVLAVSWLLALGFGFLWPSNALMTFAPAPLEFVVFKGILLIPEGFYSAVVSLLFLADLSPRFMSHSLSPVREAGDVSLEGFRPRSLTFKLRLKSLGFFLGTGCWVLLSINAMAVAAIRWLAPSGARETLVGVATILNSALIFASLTTFLPALAILAAQSREERLTERIIRWFALRDRVELRMWGFRGEKARPTFSQKYYIFAAGERLCIPEEQREAAFVVLKILGLHRSGEVDRQQLRRLCRLQDSLLHTPGVPALVSKQANLGKTLKVDYDFSEDPMQECLRAALDILDFASNPLRPAGKLAGKPQWIQLAALSAAHAGYLPNRQTRKILKKPAAIESLVRDSFDEALYASGLRTSGRCPTIPAHLRKI
jgi:hypothetical protein